MKVNILTSIIERELKFAKDHDIKGWRNKMFSIKFKYD
jgi:hypothetical protein